MRILIILFSIFIVSFTGCKKNNCTCSAIKTITLQPGPTGGNDVTANFHEGNPASANSNGNALPELAIYEWTNSGANVEGKGYISFDLSEIPSGSAITSAKLYLYGPTSSGWLPQGNQGENEFLVQRVLSAWNQQTLTFNNAPAITENNQVLVPAVTTTWNADVTISVTSLVQDMIDEGKPYGFCLSMFTKSPYRSVVFSTSEAADAVKRPKLVVTYLH